MTPFPTLCCVEHRLTGAAGAPARRAPAGILARHECEQENAKRPEHQPDQQPDKSAAALGACPRPTLIAPPRCAQPLTSLLNRLLLTALGFVGLALLALSIAHAMRLILS